MSAGRDVTPLSPAPERLSRGQAGTTGPVLAILLVVAGAALIRDALVAASLLGGPAAIPALLRAADGLTAEAWMIPVGAAGLLAGLVLIVAALRPRARRDLALEAATGLFVTSDGVARYASDAAGHVGGVLHASSTASRRRVVTTVEATADDPALADEVREAVSARLAALRRPPAVTVRVRSPRADNGRTV